MQSQLPDPVWTPVLYSWYLDTRTENSVRAASQQLLYSQSIVMGSMLKWIKVSRYGFYGEDREKAWHLLKGSGCEPLYQEMARGNLMTCALT